VNRKVACGNRGAASSRRDRTMWGYDPHASISRRASGKGSRAHACPARPSGFTRKPPMIGTRSRRSQSRWRRNLAPRGTGRVAARTSPLGSPRAAHRAEARAGRGPAARSHTAVRANSGPPRSMTAREPEADLCDPPAGRKDPSADPTVGKTAERGAAPCACRAVRDRGAGARRALQARWAARGEARGGLRKQAGPCPAGAGSAPRARDTLRPSR